MVAAVVLIAATALLVWQRWPLGDGHTFMLAEWQLWPQGGGLFALGVWAGEAGSLEDLTRRARQLGWIALAAAALWVAMAVYLNTRGQLESAFHGTSWLVMLNVVLYSIISVAVTAWFTALIRARWSGDGSLRTRARRASYATYQRTAVGQATPSARPPPILEATCNHRYRRIRRDRPPGWRGRLAVAVRPKRTRARLGGEHQPSRSSRHRRRAAIA